jgi:transcription initiation factor TFIIA large subunit
LGGKALMFSQNGRTYNDEIIGEVCQKLLEDGAPHDIKREMIHSLRAEWIKALNLLSNPRKDHERASGFREEVSGDETNGSDEDDEMDILEKNIKCYMMCLFIRVTKSKNKWKCTFKQGFINLGEGDIPFSNATGELEW